MFASDFKRIFNVCSIVYFFLYVFNTIQYRISLNIISDPLILIKPIVIISLKNIYKNIHMKINKYNYAMIQRHKIFFDNTSQAVCSLAYNCLAKKVN